MSDSGTANCVFCKIIAGEIPSPRIDEDAEFICIRDIDPQAPKHFLIIPRRHVVALDSVYPESGSPDPALVGKMFEFGVQVARKQGLLPAGFRSIINSGAGAGQTVFHLHLHLLGGAQLR